MKKRIASLVLACAAFACAAFAAETEARQLERMSGNVVVAGNGDVTFADRLRFPKRLSEFKGDKVIPPQYFRLAYAFDPEMNFEEFFGAFPYGEPGGKNEENFRENSKKLFGASCRPARFSFNAVKESIDRGAPVLISLCWLDSERSALEERAKKRPSSGTAKDLLAYLEAAKIKVKKPADKRRNIYVLIAGYNPTTRECFINQGMGDEGPWMTEKEVKNFENGMFIFRPAK